MYCYRVSASTNRNSTFQIPLSIQPIMFYKSMQTGKVKLIENESRPTYY